MASLKELRTRIASVKATQKITKAMQMVAAAKLRRAQTAAEAARPYASRMESVLSNLATALEGREGGQPLMVGTGKDAVTCLWFAPRSAGFAAALTPQSSGLRAPTSIGCWPRAKRSKSSASARRVTTSLHASSNR